MKIVSLWVSLLDPKIDKNEPLDLKVSVWCPCGPWITKIVTQGTQNGASRSPK